jgi:hypothetical protein
LKLLAFGAKRTLTKPPRRTDLSVPALEQM